MLKSSEMVLGQGFRTSYHTMSFSKLRLFPFLLFKLYSQVSVPEGIRCVLLGKTKFFGILLFWSSVNADSTQGTGGIYIKLQIRCYIPLYELLYFFSVISALNEN